jgi:hypothetical protein
MVFLRFLPTFHIRHLCFNYLIIMNGLLEQYHTIQIVTWSYYFILFKNFCFSYLLDEYIIFCQIFSELKTGIVNTEKKCKILLKIGYGYS